MSGIVRLEQERDALQQRLDEALAKVKEMSDLADHAIECYENEARKRTQLEADLQSARATATLKQSYIEQLEQLVRKYQQHYQNWLYYKTSNQAVFANSEEWLTAWMTENEELDKRATALLSEAHS